MEDVFADQSRVQYLDVTQTSSKLEDEEIHMPINVFKELFLASLNSSEVAIKKGDKHLGFIKINILHKYNLNLPLDAIVEENIDEYIASLVDIPLYSEGSDPIQAIEGLKTEIEELWEEIKVDTDLSDEWIRYKDFLSRYIQ